MAVKERTGEGRSDSDSRINTTAIRDFLQAVPLLADGLLQDSESRPFEDGSRDNSNCGVVVAPIA